MRSGINDKGLFYIEAYLPLWIFVVLFFSLFKMKYQRKITTANPSYPSHRRVYGVHSARNFNFVLKTRSNISPDYCLPLSVCGVALTPSRQRGAAASQGVGKGHSMRRGEAPLCGPKSLSRRERSVSCAANIWQKVLMMNSASAPPRVS